MDEEAFNKKFKVNKSWYISLFVVSESFQEVLKRKPASIKTLEDEVISIFDNPAQIQHIISESMTFEIQPKCKLT